MNPLFLLFGLLGAGALQLGSKSEQPKANVRQEDLVVGKKPKEVQDTSDQNTADPVAEQPDADQDPVTATPTDPTPGSNPTQEPIDGNSENVVPPQQDGEGSGGAATDPITATGTVEVMAGRVATLEAAGDDIVSIRIVSGVDHGNITVNPDNTLALVMTNSDFVGSQSFTYEVTHSDGSTTLHQTHLNVGAGMQAGGWGTGETHYMLATDENDRVVVEHGENHTKFYVSGSQNALTAADIAQIEGLSENQITSAWLMNSDYGKSEELALHTDLGMNVWNAMSPEGTISSDWLLLERGYQYEIGLLSRYSGGESELHPTYVGAWGEGDRPEITTWLLQMHLENVVFQDIHFSGGLQILWSDNVILDNVMVTGDGSSIMHSSGITVRNSEFIDNYSTEPDGDGWHAHVDRTAGIYMNDTVGTLFEGNLFDHNGWGDGWETGDAAPPSMFSHNLYFDARMSDVTLRDTITIRASSFGAQVRSGGFIEDNLFADNNAGFVTLGGDYEGAGPVGQYSLLQGNVITYAAYKESEMIGALSLGLMDRALMTSFVDNVVAHLTDPANPEELEWKWWNHGGFEADETAYYDDTVVWNWIAGSGEVNYVAEQNIEGLDTTVLNETTIQNFAQQLTGIQGATTADLANYLRAQADGQLDDVVDADLINRFFQEGFGIATDIRDSAETITFVPSDIGEGVRWDNRLNWETGDLPGLYPNDSVDLNGNHVVYGTNTTIDTLDFSGGELSLYGGRLNANGLADEGLLHLEGSGQIWVGGSDGSAVDVEVTESGRFVNTGDMSGVNLSAMDGQTILATDGAEFDVSSGRVLSVFEAAKVGFDGDSGNTAILDIQEGGTVAFQASADGLGEIGEFRSGAFGDSPNVMSGIDLGNGTLSVNLNGLSASDASMFQLMSADEIVGVFDDAMIDGLGSRDARVVVDYTNDSVTLELSAGTGIVTIDTIGEEGDISSGSEALWAALTADQGVVSETQSAILADEEEVLFEAA
jgi:hypothetical protein